MLYSLVAMGSGSFCCLAIAVCLAVSHIIYFSFAGRPHQIGGAGAFSQQSLRLGFASQSMLLCHEGPEIMVKVTTVLSVNVVSRGT